MSFLLDWIIPFIIVLGVVIVVHEYGHYIVARACNVKVLRFSVGFGKPLLARRFGKDRTEWVLAAIPFGGYVKMLDEREGDVEEHERERAFNRQSVWKRMAIVVAGPMFNLVFAVFVYAGLYMHGLPEARPMVGQPPAGTQALAAGFNAGDTVRAINGDAVRTWQEVRWRVLQAALNRETLQVEVLDARDRISTLRLDLTGFEDRDIEKDILQRIGLRLQVPRLAPLLGEVEAGSPAKQAGLQPGDRVVAVNGKPIAAWDEFVKVIQASAGKTLAVEVQRESRSLLLEVVPAADSRDKTRGRIGVAPQDLGRYYVNVRYGPFESLAKAADKTLELSLFSLRMLGKMLTGDISWKHLSGPVTIADYAGQSAKLGPIQFITFVALISISLGVLNLLPIPLLDGGHLMYYLFEVIKGSPVSERAMELGQRVGVALLLVMMAFAFYNDLNRLFSG